LHYYNIYFYKQKGNVSQGIFGGFFSRNKKTINYQMESQKAGVNNDYIINKKIEEKEETRINNSKLNN